MRKILEILFAFLVILFFIKPNNVFAQSSFISIVNPIRGEDFWDVKGQSVESVFFGESETLKQANINVTWLIRYDAFLNDNIINKLKGLTTDEKGLFLEVTPSWTKEANVNYHKGESWHAAGSAFLTGYELSERERLIDSAFDKFKKVFGYFPKSVGAWWVDAYSLNYMQKKYGIISSLIVADQYTTDNYQIWGQYFSTPYYPSKINALHPAQSLENKLPVVMVQWASRDPVNSYGNGVGESTYSLQANDYTDYHNLDTNYFSKLVNLYSKQPLNKFSQIVVGLENSYPWQKYSKEYENQIKTIAQMRDLGQISILTMGDFASWYFQAFPNLSPEQIIIADDPLGSFKKAVWFMNPYYRAGWFLNQDGSVFRDIRQYIDGREELCFKARCDSVNFATSATRVLDEVSFGHKWIIDEGKITDFNLRHENEKYSITYTNEAGKKRVIEFLPRDISIDGKISSIDGAILDATKKDLEKKRTTQALLYGLPKSVLFIAFSLLKFVLFVIVVGVVPGFVLNNKLKKESTFKKIFLSLITGLVLLTLIFYLTSLFKIRFLMYFYLFINLLVLVKLKLYKLSIDFKRIKGLNLLISLILILGTIFQIIPTFQSGLNFPYGLGFWGPNTHDGVWHISLINQLIKNVPPQNPIFAGQTLKNYHYFYDLLIAATNYLTKIPVTDLVFRFYPLLFSLSLGIGTYCLIYYLFNLKLGEVKIKVATLFSLYFVYFAGSFGWIVEFIKQRHLGGESAFWANQAVSFNLNPPFAISLIITIAIFLTLPFYSKLTKSNFLSNVLLLGSLIAFKSYAAVLMLGTILLLGIIELLKRRNPSLLIIFIFGLLLSALLFFPNFTFTQSLLLLSPFWFVNSMIDAQDRVGWDRITLMRIVGQTQKQYFKFIAAEGISLTVFILGNLGLRILSLGVLIKVKDIIKDNKFLILAIFSLLSVLIPLIFIQAGNPWNTIQFIYYYLYISAVISGVVISWVLYKTPRAVGFIILLVILILAPLNSIVTAKGYLSSKPHAYISQKELEGLNFLSRQKDGIVLAYPYNEKIKKELAEPWPMFVYDSIAYVSAFSKKVSYLEDIGQNQILLTDYKKRLVASNDFFFSPDTEKIKFLKENNIRYIYIPKIFNQRIDESIKGIKKIFENNAVVIYGVKSYD